MNQFIGKLRVRVNRYAGDEERAQSYDGWFESEVYAIDRNKFLVYDSGEQSAWPDEPGFMWVDFTRQMIPLHDQSGETLEPVVTLVDDEAQR